MSAKTKTLELITKLFNDVNAIEEDGGESGDVKSQIMTVIALIDESKSSILTPAKSEDELLLQVSGLTEIIDSARSILSQIVERTSTPPMLSPQFELPSPPSSSSSSSSSSTVVVHTLEDAFVRNVSMLGFDPVFVKTLLKIERLYVTGEIVTRTFRNEPIETKELSRCDLQTLEFVFLGDWTTLSKLLPQSTMTFAYTKAPKFSFQFVTPRRETVSGNARQYIVRGTDGSEKFITIHAFVTNAFLKLDDMRCMTFDFLKTFYDGNTIFIRYHDSIFKKIHYNAHDEVNGGIDVTVRILTKTYADMGYTFKTTLPGASYYRSGTYPTRELPFNLIDSLT